MENRCDEKQDTEGGKEERQSSRLNRHHVVNTVVEICLLDEYDQLKAHVKHVKVLSRKVREIAYRLECACVTIVFAQGQLSQEDKTTPREYPYSNVNDLELI